jgi:ankyrin repeat protein
MVKLLLHNKASVSAPDKRGLNAVHFACYYSSAEMVRLLLQADKIAARRGGSDGRVGLTKCIRHECIGRAISIATVLLSSGCSTEETDSKGNTVLMYAAFCSHPQMVSF